VTSQYNYWETRRPFSVLAGKTLTGVRGLDAGSDVVVFTCSDGCEYTLAHQQDCCESVAIEDVVGHVSDLLGTPLLLAADVSNEKPDHGPAGGYPAESYTWTFYKLATVKGYVDLRWYGTSNGYYSESVDFWQSGGPL
jgi:hypothetical protein